MKCICVQKSLLKLRFWCALDSWQVRMDARGKQLMREWWTLKLAKEADEAELASMSEQMSKIMPITHLDSLVKVTLAKTVQTH